MSDQKPVKRRRGLRIFLYALGGIVLFFLIIALIVPLVLTNERIRKITEEKASAKLNRPVQIEAMDVNYFSGAKITKLRIGERKGFTGDTFLQFNDADLRVKVWPLVSSFGKRVTFEGTLNAPEIFIERGKNGELNIADLLGGPKSEPKMFEELSILLKVTGGRVVFRDSSSGQVKETVVENINIDASMPNINSPFEYMVTATTGSGGKILCKGSPVLFHNGQVDPKVFEGEIFNATLEKIPVADFLATAGAPSLIETISGNIKVNAQKAGEITAEAALQSGTEKEMSFASRFTAAADMGKGDIKADFTFQAEPFATANGNLLVAAGGAEGIESVVTFEADLSKLPPHTAKLLNIPLTADGAPAISGGIITGKFDLKGDATAMALLAQLNIKQFVTNPAITGGTELPPEDASATLEAVIRRAPDGSLQEIDIPVIEATSSFLEAEISNCRISSLSKPENLAINMTGHLRFSGLSFSQKFGKTLGLPPISDTINFIFTGNGEGGVAKLSANGSIERERGTADPVRFDLSAKISGGTTGIHAEEINLVVKAIKNQETYLSALVSGQVLNLTADPNFQLTYSAAADLNGVSNRFQQYAKHLSFLGLKGRITIPPSTISGTRDTLTAAVKIVGSEITSQSMMPSKLSEILSASGENRFNIDAQVDAKQGRIDITRLEAANSLIALKMTDPIEVTGVNFKAPKDSMKTLAAKGALEGTIFFDAKNFPQSLLPLPKDAPREPMKFSARAARQQSGTNFDINAAGMGSTLVATGSIDPNFTSLALTKFEARVPDARILSAFVPALSEAGGSVIMTATAKAPLQEISKNLAKVQFSGRIDLQKFTAAIAKAPGLNIQGDGSITFDNNAVQSNNLLLNIRTKSSESPVNLQRVEVTSVKPGTPLLDSIGALKLTAAASVAQINVTEIMDALPKDTGEKAKTPPEKGRFDFLKNYQADIDFRANRLIYQRHVVTDIIGQLQLRDNKLKFVKPAKANVHGGQVTIDAVADLNDELIASEGHAVIQQVDLNSVTAAQMNAQDVVLGRTNMEVTWTGRGFSPEDVAKYWKADITMGVSEPVVQNFDRLPSFGGIANPLIQALGQKAFPNNRYVADNINLKMRLDGGRVVADDFTLSSSESMMFKVSGLSFGFDKTATAQIGVIPPKAMLMGYVSKSVKNDAALAIIERALEKNPPIFATFAIAKGPEGTKVSPDFLSFEKWMGGMLKENLRPENIPGMLEDILKKKAEDKLQKEEQAPAEGAIENSPWLPKEPVDPSEPAELAPPKEPKAPKEPKKKKQKNKPAGGPEQPTLN